MKNFLFYLICMTSATPVFAEGSSKLHVMLAFDDSGSLKTTASLVKQGIHIAADYEQTPKIIFDEINIGEDVGTIATNLEAAILKVRPDVIIGGITSNQALIISEIAEKQKITFLTPFATSSKVTEGKTYTFRSCFDDTFQAVSLAKFIYKEQKLRKGLIIFNNEQSYSRGIESTFRNQFIRYANVDLESRGFATLHDVDNLLVTLKTNNPKFVLIPSYQIESAEIIAKVHRILPHAKLFGTDSWGGGRLFQNIVNSEHVINFDGFYIQHWSEDSASTANRKFLSLLRKGRGRKGEKFGGTAMNAPIAVGYDAMNIILIASKTNQPLNSVIPNVNYEGATGRIVFEGAHTPRKSLFVFRISGNSEKYFKELSP